MDLIRDLLKQLLTDEDYAKISLQLGPKREEPTIYQDLANKFKEHGKVLSQVEHHRSVVRDAQLKLQKHVGGVFLLCLLPVFLLLLQMRRVQIQEILEGDKEMEEVEDEEEHGSTVGSGVGAFLAPQRKKTAKKTFLKKPSAKNAAVKPETRSSVFAKACTLSARELTRLIEEYSALTKQEDEELAEGVPRDLGATIEDNTQVSLSG